MQTPTRVGWKTLEEDFPGFGSYGKIHYQLPLAYGEPSLIESAILMEMVHSANPKKILEIGRCRGRGSLGLALATNAHVTTLDLPEPEKIYAESNSKSANELWESHGVKNKITEILVNSRDFKTEERFDVVIVDADHSYLGAKKDIELALELIGVGGLIIIHDYYKKSFPGVSAAVAERSCELNIKWIECRAEFLETSLCYFSNKKGSNLVI